MSPWTLLLHCLNIPMAVLLAHECQQWATAAAVGERKASWPMAICIPLYAAMTIGWLVSIVAFHFRDGSAPNECLILLFLLTKTIEGHRLKFYGERR